MPKIFFDLLPVILFFITYQFWGIYIATATAVGIGVIQILYCHLRGKKLDTLQWVTLAILVVLGSATLWLHNPLFIKWKPTVIYWVFALAFLVSRWFGKRYLTEKLLGTQISLSKPIWHRLDNAWMGFFTFLGMLNLYVAYFFNTDDWVRFKLFGVFGLLLGFVLGQGVYLSRHLPKEGKKS